MTSLNLLEAIIASFKHLQIVLSDDHMFKPALLSFSLLISAMFAAFDAWAQDPKTEPEIVIREEENKTFYEYRVNGILKEIKVVPKVGPEYYLVPADGGGWIREEKSQILVPSWVLFEW